MKNILILIYLALFLNLANAQSWDKSKSIGSPSLDASAIFQVNSTTKGVIEKPKMTTAQKNAISSPIEGLGVWDTTTSKAYSRGTSSWQEYVYADISATLTNKTIDTDLNTVTNIENENIKTSAGIDASKISSSSVANTEFDYLDGVTSSIQTQIDSKRFTALADGKIWVGDGAGLSQPITLSGDITTTNTGVTAIGSGVIINADINATAQIDATKIGSGAQNISNQEFDYLDNLTGYIQTQLDGKVGTGTGVYLKVDGSLASTGAQDFNAGLYARNQSEFRFYEGTGGGSNFISLKAPALLSGNTSYILPSADGTGSGMALLTDGAANLYWGTVAAGGGGGTGPVNSVSYYGADGSSKGEAGFEYNETEDKLTVAKLKIDTSTTANVTNIEINGSIKTNAGKGIDPNNLVYDGTFSEGVIRGGAIGTGTGWAVTYDTSVFSNGGIKIAGTGAGSGVYGYEFCSTADSAYANTNFQVMADIKSSSALINVCAQSLSGSGQSCNDYDGSNAVKIVKAIGVADANGSRCIGITSDSALGSGAPVYVDNLKVGPLELGVAIERPDQYSLTVTSNRSGYATDRAQGYFYKTKSGGWWMTFRITSSQDSFSSATLTVKGPSNETITFKNTALGYQAVTPECNAGGAGHASANPNVGTISITCTANTTNLEVSGDVELESKPSFVTDIVSNEYLVGTAPEAAQIKFYNDTNCRPATNAASFANANDADCDFATASKIGPVITPTNSGDISLKLASLKAGKYQIIFSGTTSVTNVNDTTCDFRLYDGTNVIATQLVYSGTGQYEYSQGMQGIIEYTTDQTSGIEFAIQGRRTSGTGNCELYATSDNSSSAIIQLIPISSVMVASLAETPKVPGQTGNIDTFGLAYGTTNLTTVCSGSPCFISQIGTAVSSLTWQSAGRMTLNTVRTYSKLQCGLTSTLGTGNALAIPFNTANALQCSNCSSLVISTQDTSGSPINSNGVLNCMGTY